MSCTGGWLTSIFNYVNCLPAGMLVHVEVSIASSTVQIEIIMHPDGKKRAVSATTGEI